MAATDKQVQTYVDVTIRPLCQRFRDLMIVVDHAIATIDDVYAVLNVQSPAWSDGRTDGVPHLMTPSDVLAVNTFLHDMQKAIATNAQLPVILKACVNGPGV